MKYQIIKLNVIQKANVLVIDFIFEPKTKSVFTKSTVATKTSLYCR